jgi:hypothetical protein
MKRIRENDEQEGVAYDWPSLLHMECILVVLHPYLSTVDLIHLSCVNKRMNTTWINNKRRLSVLQMRDRLHKLTGRKYEKKNPLLFAKMAAIKALKCSPTIGGLKKTFKCFRCNNVKTIATFTMDRVLFPYATCHVCAQLEMRKNYERCYNLIDSTFCFLMRDLKQHSIDEPTASVWCTNFLKKPDVLSELEKNRVCLKFGDYCFDYYIHKSFLQSIVEQGLRELMFY